MFIIKKKTNFLKLLLRTKDSLFKFIFLKMFNKLQEIITIFLSISHLDNLFLNKKRIV